MANKIFSKTTVISNKKLCTGIFELKLYWRGAAVRPGQFVLLKPLESAKQSVMPRPFTVARNEGKSITLIIQVVGNNTKSYSLLKEGDAVKVSGALGKPIPISKNDEHYTLVGGGMGAAALILLARNLHLTGKRTVVILGAKRDSQLFGADAFLQMSCSVATIAQNRKGGGGIVTDLLEKKIGREKKPSVIIACGPRAMLKKVSEIATTYNRKCIVVVEEIMACGTGSCKGCAVFAKNKKAPPKHVCTDGPAFAAEWIDWEKFSPACVKVEPRSRPLYVEKKHNRLGVTLVGQKGRKLELKENPTFNCSGCLGEENLTEGRINLKHIGALVPKGVTLHPIFGNATPRVSEVPFGMLNSIGLENPGVHAFIETKLPIWLSTGKPVIPNVSGFSVDEYSESCEALSKTDAAGLEVNVSCPNIDQGHGNKKIFGLVPQLTFDVIAAARAGAPKMFLIAKLSPMASNIVEIAQAAKEAGADAISLINTPLGMAIDIWTRQPKIGNLYGGMSGPQIKPLAIRMVNQLFKADLDIPIIGMGGLTYGIDAPEFILAGANAVAVGTALFLRSDEIFSEIHKTFEKFVLFHGVNNLQELVGQHK